MKGKYDCILIDPPFLSPDCQTKGRICDTVMVPEDNLLTARLTAAMTVRFLSKPASPDSVVPSTRIIVCTGERMNELVLRLYPGIVTTTYDPQHAQNRLSNIFRCYANFESEAWSWRQEA